MSARDLVLVLNSGLAVKRFLGFFNIFLGYFNTFKDSLKGNYIFLRWGNLHEDR